MACSTPLPGSCSPQTAPQGGNNNNFDLVERVTAGYVMDSLNFGRVRVVAGVRFAGTQDNTLSCNCGNEPSQPNGRSTDLSGAGLLTFPYTSVSFRMRLDSHDNSALQFDVTRGLSLDPTYLTTAVSVDNSTTSSAP